MNARNLRTLTAAVLISMFPAAAMAQGDAFTLEAAPEKEPEITYLNEIEIGVGYTDIDSFKFGEFTGIEDDGVYPIANINLLHRPAWDSNETPRYWSLEGRSLGLDSRSVRGEYGVQGNYDLFIEYQQIPHFKFNDGATPFVGAGGTSLTLPGGWTAAGNTAGMTDLLPSLRGFEVETERQNLGAGILKHINHRWRLGVDFHHDTKEGIDTIGAAFGNTGGNPRGMILPEPIDYETNRVNLFVEYSNKRSLFRLAYELSAFSNDASSLKFRNPYSTIGGWAPNSGFPNGAGETALPPDNLAHSFNLSAAHNFGLTSRVAANLTYSRYEQDERFLPYTANPNLAVTVPLPRNSLDGEITNTLLNLVYTSRPIQKLDVRAGYRFEDHDNDTPRDTFIYIAGDSQNQPIGTPNNNARINIPYGDTSHKFDAEAGYRVLTSTKLSLGYEFEYKERDFSEVETTREHTVSAKVSSSPFDMLDGWIRYTRSMRDGSSYRDNQLFLDSHADPSGTFENDPRLRKFNIADRDRDEVRAVLNYILGPTAALTLDGGFSLDDFSESAIGLSERHMASGTVALTVSPWENLSGNVFATYENYRSEQLGCTWNTFTLGCINSPPAPTRAWEADIKDRIYTLGLAADWQINSRLGVGTNFSFSRASTSVNVTGGSAVTTAPLPDLDSHWYTLGAHLNYKLKKNLEARLGYAYERLKTDDFALDNVEPNTLANVITLGEQSPNYRGHVVGVALSYKF